MEELQLSFIIFNHMKSNKSLNGVIVEKRLLNNAQRKALSDIIERRLGSKTERAREKERELESEIIAKLVKRFKVDAIQNQIEKLNKDIKNLEKMRDDLGFEKEYDGTFRIMSGEPKKLLEAEVKENSLAIRNLEDRQDILTQSIWLAETADEAKQLIQELERL